GPCNDGATSMDGCLHLGGLSECLCSFTNETHTPDSSAAALLEPPPEGSRSMSTPMRYGAIVLVAAVISLWLPLGGSAPATRAVAAGEPKFSLRDLGALDGAAESSAWGVDQTGRAVGYALPAARNG